MARPEINGNESMKRALPIVAKATATLMLMAICSSRVAAQVAEYQRPAVDRASSRAFVPDEVVVKFKAGMSDRQIEAAHGRVGVASDRVVARIEPLHVQRIRIAAGNTVAEVVDRYRREGAVEYAEPNYYAHASLVPNDPGLALQWHMFNAGTGGIDMDEAWDYETGAGVVVGILDTGVAYEDFGIYAQAPDLANTAFVAGWDFVNNDARANDDEAHGTHVAGTVAQSTNNGVGVAGVAFDATLMPVKVLDENGDGTYSDVAAGICFATDNGADVINMSLGGPGPGQVVEDAVRYAYKNGVTVVAATGNDGTQNDVDYPAAYDDYVIAVGATRYDETRSYYSDWGPEVDMMGPGGDLNVNQNGDAYNDGVVQNTFNPFTKNPQQFGYWLFHGTSMATPHVAGVAALIHASGVTHPIAVRDVLQSTAVDLGAAGRDDEHGHGLVDAPAAILAAQGRVGVFTEHSQSPHYGQEVGGPKAYYPSVVYDEDLFSGQGAAACYKLWYGTSGGQTALALSDNGVDWTDQGVVMANGYHATAGYFAGGFAGANSGGNPSGATMYYRMWYWDPSELYSASALRYTESPDGVTWFNDQPCQNGAVPFVTGTYPDVNRGTYGLGANVLYNPGATNTGMDWELTAWYDMTTGGDEAIGLMFSADGITWTAYEGDSDGNADVVFNGTYNPGDWDFDYVSRPAVVQRSDGTLRMYYSGGNGSIKDGIGAAVSTDGGLTWSREVGNPIVHVNDGVGWRDARSYTAAVIADPNSTMMWFAGQGAGGNSSIGYTSMPWEETMAAAANTPAGSPVSVAPEDEMTGSAPVSLTFAQVDEAGTTTLALRAGEMAGPVGYGWGDPALYYDLETTAGYAGAIEICIDCTGVNFGDPENLHLFHRTGDGWEDVTANVRGQMVCGETPSLSQFGVFEHRVIAALTASEVALIGSGARIRADVVSGGEVVVKGGSKKRPATIAGSITAAGNARLRAHSRIAGDVTLGGELALPRRKLAGTVQIAGEVSQHAGVSPVVLPPLAFAVDPSGPRVNVRSRSALELAPYDDSGETYGLLSVGRRGELTLRSGTYYCEAVVLKRQAELVLLLRDGPITVNVGTGMQLGRQSQVIIQGGDAGDVLFNVGGGGGLAASADGDGARADSDAGPAAVRIMPQARFAGTIYAPLGKVRQEKNSNLEGAIVARDVHLSQRATFSGRLARHFRLPSAPLAAKLAAAVDEQPSAFALLSNYPNPFNPFTTLRSYAGRCHAGQIGDLQCLGAGGPGAGPGRAGSWSVRGDLGRPRFRSPGCGQRPVSLPSRGGC